MKQPLLAVEHIVLFYGVPTAFVLGWLPLHILLLLLVFAAGCAVYLVFDRSFDNERFYNRRAIRWRHVRHILLAFAIGAAGMVVGVYFFQPSRLFHFPRQAPHFWLIIMMAYPLVSVYPQEVIYRAFLFRRYRGLFTREWTMVAASAAAFGYMHIMFGSWVSVALTLVGGALFAWTYSRTHSLLAAWFEHSLYGCAVFTVGLNQYFYHGTIQAVETVAR